MEEERLCLDDEDLHCSKLRKHLSKSASELSCGKYSTEWTSATASPQRAKSAVNPSVSGVIQKTHGFFSTLKHRWSRGRSKDRSKRRSPHRQQTGKSFENEPADYAADNSSEYSSSNTPLTQSPRRLINMVDGHRSNGTNSPVPASKDSLLHLSAATMNDSTATGSASSIGGAVAGTSSAAANHQGVVEMLRADEIQKRREATLRQHAFFQLKINLISGSDLAAMDKNGTSDPYVKFKMGGRLLHKSKTVHRDLNPIWDETFVVPIEDPFHPINIKVFDYDWGLQDDFMGSATLDLTQLELGRLQEIIIKLEDPARPQRDLGELRINATLWPRTQEDKEQYYQRHPRLADASKRLKSQIWTSVVTIVLVEAKNLPPDPDNIISEAYCRFRLGNEKFKSKTSWQTRWLEQFDLHLFDEDQMLEVTLWIRNTQMGKCRIDLRCLPREQTHGLWQQLEDCTAEVFFLLTISGTTASETITDLTSYREDPQERKIMRTRYAFKKTLQNLRDVGHLTVKVFGATGLAAADLGGKSDPFCVLELINSRLQTQTEYKTLAPNWNKIFTFNVKDMTSVLEITVFDEDRDHKVEFLGRIAIPLLRIHNGEKRWYTLKDKKMFSRAKGNSPQILLEMNVIWSPLRAALRVLDPREEKLVTQEQKFKRQIFLRNVTRLKAIIMCVLEWARYLHVCIEKSSLMLNVIEERSCFEWESSIRSIIAFIIWVCGCIWFDISTIPIILLLLILKNWFVKWITGTSVHPSEYDYDMASDDEDDDDRDKEEKKTIKERLQAIQEVSQTVQNSIGYLASLGESVKNLFNFSVPELTWLAAILLTVVSIVLQLVPTRILLLIWGIIKFSRRLIRPHCIPNNEVLDLLSRVPDNEELITFRELAPHSTPELSRRDPKKKAKIS